MNNLIFGVDLIKSKSNATISEISKLSNKKYRAQKKQFICDGIKLFCEAVEFGATIKYIVLDNSVEIPNEIINKVKKCAEKGAKILCVEGYIFENHNAELWIKHWKKFINLKEEVDKPTIIVGDSNTHMSQ